MSNATRQTISSLLLLLVVAGSRPATAGQSPDGKSSVEITEVRNVGVSAADDAKSIIEVKWTLQEKSEVKPKSFHIELEINYADGATEKTNKTSKGSDRAARFEMPTLHSYPGRPGAEMKSYKATLQTESGDSSTKDGRFK